MPGLGAVTHKKKRLIEITGKSASLRRSQFATEADMEEAGCGQAEESALSALKPACASDWAVSGRGQCSVRRDGSFAQFTRTTQFECQE